jgi:hypothetical protein
VNVIGAEHEPILYFAWYPFNVTDDLPLYALSNDTKVEDDGCNELPEDTPDLSKFVVLVRRGTCPFVSPTLPKVQIKAQTNTPAILKQTKVDNLVKKNATQALFYEYVTSAHRLPLLNPRPSLLATEPISLVFKSAISQAR